MSRGKALGALLALLIAAAGVWVLRSRSSGPGVVGEKPPAPEGSPGAPRPVLGDTLESLGRAPSFRLRFDPSGGGRLYSGGSVSDDGGRSWRPLASPDGRGLVLLGGRWAVPFAFGPGERLLLGEVLFEVPGTPSGQGPIAHAAEWNGSGWDVVLPAENPELGGPVPTPEVPVRGVGYLPGGITAVALSRRIRFTGNIERDTPGEVRLFLAAADGTLYVSIEGRTQFPLYYSAGMSEPWLPVGGMPEVTAMAEGGEGTVYLAASRFGRGRGGTIQWEPSGMRLVASHLAVHPRAPLVAAWGRDSLLIVSKDGGKSFTEVRWNDLKVAWAAFDPGQTDSFLVLDRAGTVHRLSLGEGGQPATAAGPPPS